MSDGLKLDPFALWANTSQRLHFSQSWQRRTCLPRLASRCSCLVALAYLGCDWFRRFTSPQSKVGTWHLARDTRLVWSRKTEWRWVKWTNPKTNITFLHTSLDIKMFAQGRCSRTCRIDSDHGARRCLTWHKSHSELPSGRWSISIVKFKPSGYSMGQI